MVRKRASNAQKTVPGVYFIWQLFDQPCAITFLICQILYQMVDIMRILISWINQTMKYVICLLSISLMISKWCHDSSNSNWNKQNYNNNKKNNKAAKGPALAFKRHPGFVVLACRGGGVVTKVLYGYLCFLLLSRWFCEVLVMLSLPKYLWHFDSVDFARFLHTAKLLNL